jgi:hypothetical protein
MCTERHITFTNCKCGKTLILKCAAQIFIEEQAAKKNRKLTATYRHCINLRVTSELVNGCCKGKAEGRCFVECAERGMQRQRQREENMDGEVDVGRKNSLEPTDGRIADSV